MKAVLGFFRVAVAQSLQYRSELFLWSLLTFVNTFILILVWLNILSSDDSTTSVGGFTLASIIQYYFIVTFIEIISAAHFESWRSSEINTGKIDFSLIRPLGYPLQVLLQDLGGKILWISISLPIFAVSIFVVSQYVDGLSISVSPLTLIQFIFVLIFAYWFEFCLALATVFTTFWFESAEGLQHFKWILISIFSVLVIPISFAPTWLKTIIMALPFKYLYAVPTQLLQGTMQVGASDWLYMGVVSILSFVFIKILWNKAKLHYASAGG
jgi:ABC-2 type transport system permease protein